MINHARSFYAGSMKLRSEDLESCGIPQALWEQLRPLIRLPRVARENDDELSFIHHEREHAK